jgi:N-acetylmuramoyl-L-alanine amidase
MKKLIASIAVSTTLLMPNLVQAEEQYTVVSGDSLWKVATERGISLQALRQANAKWDDLILVGQTLKLPTNEVNVEVNKAGITGSERDLMARLVRAEAEGEPYAGKVAVATVIFNRVASDQFPDTIKEVIYQSRQFTPVSNGAINTPATAEDFKAVDEAFSEYKQGAGSLFFYNPAIATSRWLDGKQTTLVIGNHVFKK